MDTVKIKNMSIAEIKEILFSKDTISALNKQVLEKFNLTEVNKESKKKVIDLLIANMKIVYKSLDPKKINNKNMNSVFTQFNKVCLEQTSKELSKDDVLALIQPNSSQLKFERDFKSSPNSGNKLMERPQAVSNRSINQSQSQFLYPPGFKNENVSKPDAKFDRLFKPIVDQVDDNFQSFNNYQHGRGGEDFSKRMDKFMNEREVETSINKRPPTPDFLKPIKTSSKPDAPDFGNRPQQQSNKGGNYKPMPVQRKSGGKPNFSAPIPDEEIDNAFLTVNEHDTDLYNINNIDKPMDIPEIEEDHRPFEQRLKNLESERNNISMPKSNGGKINFQDPNLLNNDDDDSISDYKPKLIDEIKRNNDPRRQQNNDTRNSEMDSRRADMVSRRSETESRRPEMDSRRPEMESRRPEMDSRRPDMESRRPDMESRRPDMESRRQDMESRRPDMESRRQDMESYNVETDRNELSLSTSGSTQRMKTMEEMSNTKTNKNSQIDMKKVQMALDKLTKPKQIDNSELLELKKENDLLKKKIVEFSDKNDRGNFDILKKELANDFQKLNEKDSMLTKKEEEMKLLLKKYNFLYGVRHIQMDISPGNPVNDFDYEFEQVNNIIGLKLMSYSIPQARYNIEENKNNIFKIIVGGTMREAKINSGKYKIEDLITILATKTGLIFELNCEQKIEISQKPDGEPFDIVQTPLSKDVLGFTASCNNDLKFIADKTWDLRIEDKIYLFINNIEESVPFAVLYLGNQAVQQFRFEEPINLNKLELVFKDSKGRPFNFYGLTYSLNVQLEINEASGNELTL
jgi:hypothetical protein